MPPFSICSPNCNYWDAEYVFTHCTGIICMLQQIPPSVYPVWRHHHLPFILAFFSGFPTTMIVKNNNPTTKETIGTSLKIHPSYLYVIMYLVLQIDIVYTFQNIFFFSLRDNLVSYLLFLMWITTVRLQGHVQYFATPWTAISQASLSISNSQSLLKLMTIKSVKPSNCLLLLLTSVFSRIRVFVNESVLCIRWP